MTRIDFYHDANDRLLTAARIIQKAYARAHRVVVLVPDREVMSQLDRLLWMHPATGFIPHCRSTASLASETPVLLAEDMNGLDEEDLLVNLSTRVPDGFSRFSRVIEIIGRDADDRIPGRDRFRHYRDNGHTVHSHSLGESN